MLELIQGHHELVPSAEGIPGEVRSDAGRIAVVLGEIAEDEDLRALVPEVSPSGRLFLRKQTASDQGIDANRFILAYPGVRIAGSVTGTVRVLATDSEDEIVLDLTQVTSRFVTIYAEEGDENARVSRVVAIIDIFDSDKYLFTTLSQVDRWLVEQVMAYREGEIAYDVTAAESGIPVPAYNPGTREYSFPEGAFVPLPAVSLL